MKNVFWVWGSLLWLSACQMLSTGNSQSNALNFEEGERENLLYVPKETPFRSADDKVFDLIHTSLRVSFDWESQSLRGVANLKLSPYYFSQIYFHKIILS